MDVTVKDAESCVKNLSIVVDEKEVEKVYEDIFNEFKHDIVIPGFRKGKFPRKLFERKYADTIEKDVKNRIREEYVGQAIEDKKIEAVLPPKVDEGEFDRTKPFEMTVTVEIKPEFEVPSLKDIPLEKEEHEITDDMINEQVDYMRERRREYKAKDGDTVDEGDRIHVDYTITVDEEEVDTVTDGTMFVEDGGAFLGEVKDYPKKVVGKKIGSHTTLHAVLPPYFKEKKYQGKEATVKVAIKKIDEKVLPEIDNKDFLQFCGVETADDLKKRIEEDIKNAFEQAEHSRLVGQVYDYFGEKADFDLPPTLVEDQISSRKRRRISELENEKKEKDEIDKTIEDEKNDIEDGARKSLRNYFLIEKIAEDNTIVATEDEINQRIMSIAMQQRVTPADMRQHLERTGGIDSIRSGIREEKTLKHIIEKADVKVGKAKSKSKESGKKKTASKSSESAKKKTAEKKSSASAKKKTAKKKSSESAKKKTAKKKSSESAKKKTAKKSKKKE